MAGERRADVTGKDEGAGCGAIVEHPAAAYSRFLGIGVFREIPVRKINLQQMVKHVAGDHRAAAADVQLEIKMSGRMTAGGQYIDELVELVRAGNKVGAARVDDRQHAFAERAELRRRRGRIAVDFAEVIDVQL